MRAGIGASIRCRSSPNRRALPATGPVLFDVPACAKLRFGRVWPGTDANHASLTADARASANSTGNWRALWHCMIWLCDDR
ncbi:hypothetical protein BX592_13811 [Paraburkholderia rhizosphaerae]|uniref:Uncharacterized protein n=1 Tax=Paraburkholderia rhizosphaerae TaxID=480658 RepID=A0A4R8L5R6_9BURK|nr:hypothetical protein BX592_13811 [Paraburkholderia rhizosphaerae]